MEFSCSPLQATHTDNVFTNVKIFANNSAKKLEVQFTAGIFRN